MARALGSQADVAAAGSADGVTALRLEGFGPSVAARRALIEAMGSLRVLSEGDAEVFWAALGNPLPDAAVLWRLSLPPSRAAEVVDRGLGPWAMDWAGARVWLASEDAEAVRGAAAAVGGHALLVRAPEALRGGVPAFHPQPGPVMALEARLRRAFDPAGVFETGRFLDAD
jgi:glycolate oxidase FAD binding subunit